MPSGVLRPHMQILAWPSSALLSLSAIHSLPWLPGSSHVCTCVWAEVPEERFLGAPSMMHSGRAEAKAPQKWFKQNPLVGPLERFIF